MPPTIAKPTISIRDEKNEPVDMPLEHATPDAFRGAVPYRTLRWYLGQMP